MDYDPDAPRTPRNDRTNSYTGVNDRFTPVSVASSLVETVVDDMSQDRIRAITEQAIRHEKSRLYKKVLITDMIILNQLGQVVENPYKLVPFTTKDKRKLSDGLWDDHIYNMYGENITTQHHVETSHNQDIAAIFNANADSDSGSDQNARKRRKAGGKRTYKKNSKKNNSKNNKRNSKKNNSKK